MARLSDARWWRRRPACWRCGEGGEGTGPPGRRGQGRRGGAAPAGKNRGGTVQLAS